MNNNKPVFEKMNYILMVAGILLLIIGLIVMTLDKEDYGFGTLGITIGPVILLIGLIVEFFAIFYKSKNKE